MRKWTIMVIPDGRRNTRQFQVYAGLSSLVLGLSLVAFLGLGYLLADYWQLRQMRSSFASLVAENEGIKGEARFLMDNLAEVKGSLEKVDNYAQKLHEMVKIRSQKMAKKTGIAPVSTEYPRTETASLFDSPIPLGVATDKLVFRPVFHSLQQLGSRANAQALNLKTLLSTLGQHRSLLASIPALTPTKGWLASGYGIRVSPFTGEKVNHRGVDIAAHKGTPIFAPADGVVIFSGKKSGYGNFVMIAHGYGVVTRFGHNDQNMVDLGQKVSRGDQIATVGMSGRSTGPHLHYEIWVDGRPKNPTEFMLNMDDYQVY